MLMVLSAALFITKWVHSVETDEINGKEPKPEEQELLTYMKDLFEEADYDSNESRSFAAGMARIWALFLQDVSNNFLISPPCSQRIYSPYIQPRCGFGASHLAWEWCWSDCRRDMNG